MSMLIIRAFLIVTLIIMHDCGKDNECGRNCVVDKRDTIMCTDVPSCIPEGITKVEVNNSSNNPAIITTSNFTGKNWDTVTYLRIAISSQKIWILSDASFVALESVRELHINVERSTIDPNALNGLSSLEVIDFTGCHSLNSSVLHSLLNGTNKMAGLNKIVLSNWNTWEAPYDFDDKLIDVLLPRNITSIDVSNSYIHLFDMTVLKRMVHLKSLNLSRTTTSSMSIANLQYDDLKHIDMVDVSFFGLPNEAVILPIRYVFRNAKVYESVNRFQHFAPILEAFGNINATGIVRKPTSFWVYNCQLIMKTKVYSRLKALECKKNNLNRLDLNIPGGNLTMDLEYLGLSNNDLEFLHSSILSCMPNLKKLDLSRNRMYIMHGDDPQQFGQLLSGVPDITNINLSKNNLTYIPRDFFKGCRKISSIDLSYNRLTQFTVNITGLTSLRIFDMHSNNIKILDASSLHNLISFPSSENGDEGTPDVILTSNPISCSVCNSKPFLQWLLSTRLVDIKSQGLTCIDEIGNRNSIDETTISAVHYICMKSTILISVTVSAPIASISAIAVFVWLYKRKARENKLAHRDAVIGKIREGEGKYEFPVFLSYSSEDEEFARDNILPHLNENLRLIAGIYHDRNLVCTGDAHLRPGFYVHDEIDICLDRCSVVIVLVTENYCVSDYCGIELEKAYMKRNPVILMFKEHVREDLMSRTMRHIYKRNVRILWVEQNGEFILQTTWENVCTSIIDLIQ